jgi:hypothetical protein
VPAGFALPNRPGRVGVDGRAPAPRAKRSAAVVSEPYGDEGSVRFVIGHAQDRFEAQRAGGGGQEEVLGHGRRLNEYRWRQL